MSWVWLAFSSRRSVSSLRHSGRSDVPHIDHHSHRLARSDACTDQTKLTEQLISTQIQFLQTAEIAHGDRQIWCMQIEPVSLHRTQPTWPFKGHSHLCPLAVPVSWLCATFRFCRLVMPPMDSGSSGDGYTHTAISISPTASSY